MSNLLFPQVCLLNLYDDKTFCLCDLVHAQVPEFTSPHHFCGVLLLCFLGFFFFFLFFRFFVLKLLI